MSILSFNVTTSLFAAPDPAPDYESCSYFENVSASITEHSDGTISASFYNSNDHAVMVFLGNKSIRFCRTICSYW